MEGVKVGVQNPSVNDATAQDTDDGVWFMMVEAQNNLDTWGVSEHKGWVRVCHPTAHPPPPREPFSLRCNHCLCSQVTCPRSSLPGSGCPGPTGLCLS